MLPGRGRSPERVILGAGPEKSRAGKQLATATTPPGGLEEHVSCRALGWTATVMSRFLQQRLSG